MGIDFRTSAAEHRSLLDYAAMAAGFQDPVAISLSDFESPLLRAARRGRHFDLDGVFIRDWDPSCRREQPGAVIGGRLYEIEGISFAVIRAQYDSWAS